jgi:hypothetical protein
MEFTVRCAALAGDFGRDSFGDGNLVGACSMTTPFRALQPFEPRVVDIAYSAMLLPCVDNTDATDITDQSGDVTDDGEEI